MSEPNKHMGPYSFADIERYLQGKLSSAEMHELEKAAVQDPFLADAIEGYQLTDIKKVEDDLVYINQQLLSEPAKIIPAIVKRNLWWRVAAASIVLVGAGIFGWKIFTGKNNTQELAVQQSVALKESARTITAAGSKKDSLNTRQKTTVLANNNNKAMHDLKKNAIADNIAARDMVSKQSVAALSPNTFALRESAYEKDTVLFDKNRSKDLVADNTTLTSIGGSSIHVNGNDITRYSDKQTERTRVNPNNVLANKSITMGSLNASSLASQANKIKTKNDTVKLDMEEIPTRGYLSPKDLLMTTTGGLTSLTVAGNISAAAISRSSRISIDTPVVSGEQQMHVTFFEALPVKDSKTSAPKDDLLKVKKDSMALLRESMTKTYSASEKKEAGRSEMSTANNAGKESDSYVRTAVSVNPVGGWYNFTKYLNDKIAADESIKKETSQHGSAEIKMNISVKGKVSNVRILNSFNTQLNPVIIKAVRWGPRWVSSDFLEKKDFIFKVNL